MVAINNRTHNILKVGIGFKLLIGYTFVPGLN